MSNENLGSSEILDTHQITLVQAFVIFMCFLGMMLDGFDIVIISFTAPAISRDWGIGSESLGLVFSAGLLGMTFGAMFVSSIADIYGRRLVVSAGFVVSGAATAAVWSADSVTQLMLLRFIAGVGLGTLTAVLPALGGEYCPQERRNFLLAIICSGGNLGAVIGGLMAAWVIPEYGWRVLYLYTGIVTMLVGVVVYLVVPESISYLMTRRGESTLANVNRVLSYIGQKRLERLPDISTEKIESASVKSLLTPSRRATTLITWGTYSMGYAGMFFLISWLPKLFVDAGVPEDQSIRAVVILTFGSIVGAIFIGWLSKWWKLNHLIGLSFLIAAVLTVMLSLVMRDNGNPMALIWIVSFLIGVTLNGAFVNLYAIALIIYPPAIRVTGIGWCYGLGRSGAIISPALAGFLLGYGVSESNVVAIFAVTILLAAYFVWIIKVRVMP